MFAKLFAWFGFANARRWDAQSAAVRLGKILQYLEGADSSLEESDYVFAERYLTQGSLAEFHKEQRALRRKFTIRACKFGLIECAERQNKTVPAELQAWRNEERQRSRSKRRTLDPIEPAASVEDLTVEDLQVLDVNFKRDEPVRPSQIKFPYNDRRASYE